MNAVVYYGFGGAYSVAAHSLGIPITAVIEPGGFGIGALRANAERVGFTGRIHLDHEAPLYESDLIYGNPPCSGFSNLNSVEGTNARGADNPINDCMWELIGYAGRTNPKMVIFESVQGAFKLGRGLMQEFREKLERMTGHRWYLHHVMMSGATVGAAQVRRRYFFVASRIPFGIEPPEIQRVWTYKDAIGDLENLPLQRALQPYDLDTVPSDFARSHMADGVRDHITGQSGWERRIASIAHLIGPGETQREGLIRMIENGEDIPEWRGKNIVREINGQHYSGVFRVYEDEPGRVITGAGGLSFVHYNQDRTLTVRETARLMGFPDWFDWGFASTTQVFKFLGKQVPVENWEWMLGWAQNAIEGTPGSWAGEEIGEDEWLIQITNDFSMVYHSKTRTQPVDARTNAWRKHMEKRQEPGYQNALPSPAKQLSKRGQTRMPKVKLSIPPLSTIQNFAAAQISSESTQTRPTTPARTTSSS